MFAHAVMQPGRNNSAPPSPGRKLSHDGYLPPACTAEKGQCFESSVWFCCGQYSSITAQAEQFGTQPHDLGIWRATVVGAKGECRLRYVTPGVKRGGGAGAGAGGEGVPRDGTMTPPALPPRSATLGQAERGRLDAPSYQTRQKSPLKAPAPTIQRSRVSPFLHHALAQQEASDSATAQH